MFGSVRDVNPERSLMTVLFTDIVGSTEQAALVGDARWRELLVAHERMLRREVEAAGAGRVVKLIGDGSLSTFEGPARAIRCAERICAAGVELGVEVRAGLHIGECEVIDNDVAGIAVHIAARISAQAGAREVLVSRTVRDLVTGSGIAARRPLARTPSEPRLAPDLSRGGECRMSMLNPVSGGAQEGGGDSKVVADGVRVIADAELRGHGELDVRQTRFERCYVHNSRAQGGRALGVELIDCTIWSCAVFDVHLEDCVVLNLKTSPGGGGRSTPLFLWGGSARRVTVRGTIGGIVWNPPRRAKHGFDVDPVKADEVRRYYDSIDDWALDVSQARFRSVPTFNFGPPARLVRRDPETQPVIAKRAAERALKLIGTEIGIWRIVLRHLVEGAWPDEIVLMPGLGGSKSKREEQLRGLERLRRIGALEGDE